MKVSYWLLSFTLSSSLALASPSYFSVHIDNLQPLKQRQFEDARSAWLKVLNKQQLSDGRGFFLQVGKAFYSFRGFETFAELDEQKKARAKSKLEMDQTALKSYDRLSDESLVFPHASEIWKHEESLDYIAAGAERTLYSAPFLEMVVEKISPTPQKGETQYEQTWKQIRDALTKVKYPLTRVAYFSTYGSGKLITFWLASSQKEQAEAPSLEKALTEALGSTKARDLLKKFDECIVAAERVKVVRRTDLDSPK